MRRKQRLPQIIGHVMRWDAKARMARYYIVRHPDGDEIEVNAEEFANVTRDIVGTAVHVACNSLDDVLQRLKKMAKSFQTLEQTLADRPWVPRDKTKEN
jgi:hypothetical protein